MSVGIALLGSGLACEIHSKTLRAVAPQARRFYASRDAGRAAAVAARFGGAGHFGSYDAALASPEIDAVTIALPPSLHLEWALRALSAGKHVIVEKPPFLTSAAFDEIEPAARRSGRQVLVAENYFYKPLTGALKMAITRGDIGRVLVIQLNALKRQQTGNWRDDRDLAGGGALFEGGIHWISLLANIGLTPCRVRAAFPDGSAPSRTAAGGAGRVSSAPAPHERNAVVTIEYAEGAVATLTYSWDAPALLNGMRMSRVYGTEGTLRFETNGVFAATSGRRRRVSFPGLRDLAGYRAMTIDFIAAIEENRAPKYDLALARRDLQLVEQAYASSH